MVLSEVNKYLHVCFHNLFEVIPEVDSVQQKKKKMYSHEMSQFKSGKVTHC